MLNLVAEKGASKDHYQSISEHTNVVCAKIWIGFCLVKIFIYNRRILFFFFFYFSSFGIIYACISHSHTCRALIHYYRHPFFSFFYNIISILSLLISFSHIFSNLYLNYKMNSKLSLILKIRLTSTLSILTHATFPPSPVLIFLLNA